MTSEQNEEIESPNTPNGLVAAYLKDRVPEYQELLTLRREGWESSAAENHFNRERKEIAQQTPRLKNALYKMTCDIGKELDAATGAITSALSKAGDIAVLDICMAPGGFTTTALKVKASAKICGITLPLTEGGYEIRVQGWKKNPNMQIEYRDVTMLAAEMGVDVPADISAAHPDSNRFSADRPFQGMEFDLIFCGGTVLPTQQRAEYREHCEMTRLEASQLVLGMQRLREGGTLVAVMHRADLWHSVALLCAFNRFSDVALFKPANAHTSRSSFYMVASNVQPRHPEAVEAVRTWKQQWRDATFGKEMEGSSDTTPEAPIEAVEGVLREFGEKHVRLSTPIFRIQADALRKAPWKRRR